MITVTVTRIGEFQNATFGVLSIEGRPLFVTLEDAWRNNEKMVSCIPKGKYKLTAHTSPKFGKCYLVNDVPNRSHILIHAGNTHHDTLGCILIGQMFNPDGQQSSILQSRSAMQKFMQLMSNKETAEIEIK